MKRLFLILMITAIPCVAPAGDLTFDSFEAAEAAAKKRAAEYQKRMDEHIKNVNENWEKQQKDLGSDSSSPDITKITTRSDGEKSSSNDASQNLENAVNSSVNKLKDQMVSSAGPNSTGFAGGGAGYQWKVKFVNGKYVLSDSYNEAEFGTGKSKPPKPAAQPTPQPESEDSDSDSGSSAVAAKPSADKPPTSGSTTSGTPAPSSTSGSPAGTAVSSTPSGDKPSATSSTASTAPASPADKPSSPGLDPAPPNLPPPAIKLVIQHPTDFSEEVFSSNADSASPSDYKLEKFKIPEDTRIKIAVEVSKDINPEDVSLVITDDEGERAPVTSARMKNYRHMFRVPSEDKYSASVLINDKSKPGNYTKKLMQVRIPVTKVDFESRTIDNQRGSRSGGNSSSADMSSASTSSSGGNYTHSSSHGSQQVDLSDLYSDGSAASTNAGQPTGSSYTSGGSGSSYGYHSSGSSGSSGNEGSYASAGDAYGTSGSDSTSQGQKAYSGSNPGKRSSQGSSAGTGSRLNPGNQSGSGDSSSDGQDIGSENGEFAANTDSENESGSSYGDSGDYSGSGDSYNTDGASTAYGDHNSSEYGDNTYQENSDVSGANSGATQGGFRIVSARDINVNPSDPAGADAAGKKLPSADTDAIIDESPDPFVMALSLRNEKLKIYQSFDFIDQASQISGAIPAGNEIIFNLTLGKKVDPASINIKLFNGTSEHSGNLQTMGESFACVFPAPTTSSFVQLTGKADGQTFIYRLSIPVKK